MKRKKKKRKNNEISSHYIPAGSKQRTFLRIPTRPAEGGASRGHSNREARYSSDARLYNDQRPGQPLSSPSPSLSNPALLGQAADTSPVPSRSNRKNVRRIL